MGIPFGGKMMKFPLLMIFQHSYHFIQKFDLCWNQEDIPNDILKTVFAYDL